MAEIHLSLICNSSALSEQREKVVAIKLFDNIVNAAKNGLISANDASEMLERLAKYDESRFKDRDRMIVRRYSNIHNIDCEVDYNSPEEILIQKEKQKEADEVYKIIRVALSEYEYFILNESTYKSLREIGERLNLSEQYLSKLLQDIRAKVIAAMGDKAETYKLSFQEPQSVNTPNEPPSMGFPYEQEMKLPLDMTWQGKYGSVREKRKDLKCRIPEYLAGCGSMSICTICDEKCSRKECFPEQPELSEEKKAIIMSIIDNNTVEE